MAPYKSPGMDGIFLALLQEGQGVLIPKPVTIFRACLATGYVSAIWHQVKVVFIPKPRSNSYCGTRDFRTISLTFFLLTTMDRLVDRFLRDEILALKPLHPNQHSNQLVSLWKWLFISSWFGLRRQEIALGVFLDIEGAFNNTSYNSLCKALAKHGVDHTIIRSITATLEGQVATATLGGFSRSIECLEAAHREGSCLLSYGALLLMNCWQGSMWEVFILQVMQMIFVF